MELATIQSSINDKSTGLLNKLKQNKKEATIAATGLAGGYILGTGNPILIGGGLLGAGYLLSKNKTPIKFSNEFLNAEFASYPYLTDDSNRYKINPVDGQYLINPKTGKKIIRPKESTVAASGKNSGKYVPEDVERASRKNNERAAKYSNKYKKGATNSRKLAFDESIATLRRSRDLQRQLAIIADYESNNPKIIINPNDYARAKKYIADNIDRVNDLNKAYADINYLKQESGDIGKNYKNIKPPQISATEKVLNRNNAIVQNIGNNYNPKNNSVPLTSSTVNSNATNTIQPMVNTTSNPPPANITTSTVNTPSPPKKGLLSKIGGKLTSLNRELADEDTVTGKVIRGAGNIIDNGQQRANQVVASLLPTNESDAVKIARIQAKADIKKANIENGFNLNSIFGSDNVKVAKIQADAKNIPQKTISETTQTINNIGKAENAGTGLLNKLSKPKNLAIAGGGLLLAGGALLAAKSYLDNQQREAEIQREERLLKARFPNN